MYHLPFISKKRIFLFLYEAVTTQECKRLPYEFYYQTYFLSLTSQSAETGISVQFSPSSKKVLLYQFLNLSNTTAHRYSANRLFSDVLKN